MVGASRAAQVAQGVPTLPEVDPQRDGTKPDEFAHDHERLQTNLETFSKPLPKGAPARIPCLARSRKKSRYVGAIYTPTITSASLVTEKVRMSSHV